MSEPRIAFVLGTRPGPGSLLPDVVARLRAAGARVSADVVGRDGALPRAAAAADLVVLRALDRRTLVAAAMLEAAGVRCCNRVAATTLARDKAGASARLQAAGVPVPRTRLTQTWEGVRRIVDGPAAVKAVQGSRGLGVLLVGLEGAPAAPPFPGPWLVQERVPSDGRDRKLYVAGNRVGGVLRVWPPRTLRDKRGVPLEVTAALAHLARACGDALGLEVYGVDVVGPPDRPCVVDVNAFPGFKGVDAAATWIAAHLLDACPDTAITRVARRWAS
jgi:ribosomal protein S6--L-glutamate ligase